MMPRCLLLATAVSPTKYRCPTGTSGVKFHYHGYDASQPYRPMVGGRPCTHKHKTPDAADTCTVKGC